MSTQMSTQMSSLYAYFEMEKVGAAATGRRFPWMPPPYVKFIHPGGRRTWVKPRYDYSRCNSTGNRGFYYCYDLPEGIYEVLAWTNWQRAKGYYIRVENGAWREITSEEMREWLQQNTA